MKDENAEDGVRVERFFGLIRVFASATLKPGLYGAQWSRASGRSVAKTIRT